MNRLMKILIASMLAGIVISSSAFTQSKEPVKIKPALVVIDIQNEFLPYMDARDTKMGMETINWAIMIFREMALPIIHFFRSPEEFTLLETTALGLCAGRVLDAGAGTGLHSLFLQEKGLSVTAIDINPIAVSIMTRRGVKDTRCADLFDLEDGPYDTILMLGHGIGMVETIAGLDRFLILAQNLLSENGRTLIHSIDVRATDDPSNLAYHEANRKTGRYIGEIRIQFEHQGRKGPYCGWLHVAPGILNEHADRTGWTCKKVLEQEHGEFLACLTRKRPC